MRGWLDAPGSDSLAHLGGRPCGDLRGAVLDAVHAAPAAVSWLDVAPRLQVDCEPRLVRDTINNLARSGLVERVGRRTAPGINRGLTLYAAATPGAQPELSSPGWAALQGVWGGVVRGAAAVSSAPELCAAASWTEFV